MSRTDVQLYDKNGNEINPKTLASLVTMDGGGTVEQKVAALENSIQDAGDALSKAHEHANGADVLDKLSVQGGRLCLDGKDVDRGEVGAVLLEPGDKIPSNLAGNGIVFRKLGASA